MMTCRVIFFSVFLMIGVGAQASVQVVQSVPLETTIQVPGLELTQKVWIDLIQSAKKNIDLEEFYISSQAGQSLVPVLDALKAAANRGVQIRVLIDSQFYANMSVDANQLATVKNISLKTIDFSKLGGVMHAKYFVVDGMRAYVGSANFDWLALSHIHEIGLKIDDASIAGGLEAIFNQDWGSGAVPAAPHAFVQSPLYATPASLDPNGVNPTLAALVSMMDQAKQSIKIQNYEYNTRASRATACFTLLDDAIRRAAARGVKVEMLLDKNAMKVGAADLTALSKVKNVSVKTVVIPEWSGGPLKYARLIHSKYLITDDASIWVGSENWSEGYFKGCRNVGLIIQDENAVSSLIQVHATLWASPYATAL